MRKISVISLICLAFQLSLFSQTGSITNIQVTQQADGTGNVNIYFTLSGPDPTYLINLEVSFNNGSSYTTISNTYLSGNIGVTPGTNRHILWNGQGSHNNTYSAQTKIKLIATLCGMAIIDSRDGKTYNTVQIGTQCWLKENLNIGTRINGTQNQENNTVIEKYCYDDNEYYCDVYGGLYQWDELMNYTTSSNSNPSDRQGICPIGWHLPSDDEWCQMEIYIDPSVNCLGTEFRGSDAGGKMKEEGYNHWAYPNVGATNSSGFSALPGGGHTTVGTYIQLNIGTAVWSSTESSTGFAWVRHLREFSQQVYRTYQDHIVGHSVRCLKDN